MSYTITTKGGHIMFPYEPMTVKVNKYESVVVDTYKLVRADDCLSERLYVHYGFEWYRVRLGYQYNLDHYGYITYEDLHLRPGF